MLANPATPIYVTRHAIDRWRERISLYADRLIKLFLKKIRLPTLPRAKVADRL